MYYTAGLWPACFGFRRSSTWAADLPKGGLLSLHAKRFDQLNRTADRSRGKRFPHRP